MPNNYNSEKEIHKHLARNERKYAKTKPTAVLSVGVTHIFHPPQPKKNQFSKHFNLLYSIIIFSSHFLLTISIIHLGTQIWPNKVVWQPRGQVQFAISPCVLRQWNVGHQIIKPGTKQRI